MKIFNKFQETFEKLRLNKKAVLSYNSGNREDFKAALTEGANPFECLAGIIITRAVENANDGSKIAFEYEMEFLKAIAEHHTDKTGSFHDTIIKENENYFEHFMPFNNTLYDGFAYVQKNCTDEASKNRLIHTMNLHHASHLLNPNNVIVRKETVSDKECNRFKASSFIAL